MTLPASSFENATTLAHRRRRRHSDGRGLLDTLSCLWKSPVSPFERSMMKTQRSTSTFLGDDEDYECQESSSHCRPDPPSTQDGQLGQQQSPRANQSSQSSLSISTVLTNHNSVLDEMTPAAMPVCPPENATPRQLLAYYEARLLSSEELDWTERANLYYTTGCLYVKLREYGAATSAFEAEARILRQQGVGKDALVPIYQGLAKLWCVRQPHTAIQYYERALQCCTDPREVQELRNDMGRLLFQTGNLESALKVSICRR